MWPLLTVPLISDTLSWSVKNKHMHVMQQDIELMLMIFSLVSISQVYHI